MGTSGDDTINGSGITDRMSGGAGNDVLAGYAADGLFEGDSSDAAYVDHDNEFYSDGNSCALALLTGACNEQIWGKAA